MPEYGDHNAVTDDIKMMAK